MPEITVDIIWGNKPRGRRYEALTDIRRDGNLVISGIFVYSDGALTEDEITDRAIDIWLSKPGL